MSTPVLALDAVSVRRDGVCLLDGVSLTVQPREHWALIGGNGAGKSTLLRVLGAQLYPTAGTVEVLGSRLGHVDVRELRKQIGYVDARHPLEDRLRVRDVVLTGATQTVVPVPRWSPSPAELDRASTLLAVLGVSAIADRAWDVLSTGERQRVLIARALMAHPHLLLLDEPATGLDLVARDELVTSLTRLAETYADLASVTATHHLDELPPTTTHAVLLRAGRVVAAGPVDDVLADEPMSRALGAPVGVRRDAAGWYARPVR